MSRDTGPGAEYTDHAPSGVIIMVPLLVLLSLSTPTWKAGVAVRTITPKEYIWMSGYAARKKPAEGKETELYLKALALEAPDGTRAVLVTSDLIGIPRSLAEGIRADVAKKPGLKAEQLMLTCSHTHCGPVVRDNLIDMYPMSEEQGKKVTAYTRGLRKQFVEAITEAVSKLAPAKLSVAQGTAAFAVNRRQVTAKGIINGTNPDGPVDRTVPVLRVEDAKGKLVAVAFGYACHNTTMAYYKWSGDYAGFAQAAIEKAHPGAAAMFWTGCGADANPLPRGKLELCQKYGKMLADAVERVLAGKLKPVSGGLKMKYAEVELAYAALPSKEKLAADAISRNYAERKRAEKLLVVIKGGGKIDDHYRHYPVQVWKLGDQVTWVALGGEVVVDYSIRLKKELKGERAVWVAGYANDVMAYVASKRVLKEGGYEADSSMIYYGLPSRWADSVEEKIVAKVKELAK
jgi:hypothetical protein